jgi:hypothetical protein
VIATRAIVASIEGVTHVWTRPTGRVLDEILAA